MFKKDMTEKQLAEKNLFVEKVTAAGWDIGTTDQLLESGLMNVTPEGFAEYRNPRANLELSYHAAGGYVALLVGEKDSRDHMKFRLHCGEKLGEALDAIVGARDTLSQASFTGLIEKLLGLCREVFIERENGELVKVDL